MKLLVLLVSLVAAKINEVLFCESAFDFKFKGKVQPKNQVANLDFCIEHAANTCCLLSHSDAIRLRVEKMVADD